jgi:DNA repair photolyase
MGLNVAKGNMYQWVTHTWNTVKGECPHACSYCFCKRWGKQPELHFDKRELKTDLGEGNFIFVGSSCDVFAEAIPHDWIMDTLAKASDSENNFLFQSKNPEKMARYKGYFPTDGKSFFCTTIETNRFYDQIMRNSPMPEQRAFYMNEGLRGLTRYITIEPILAFDLAPLVELVRRCEPVQVNIGADSGGNNLPEPSRNAVMELIDDLSLFTRVEKKANLKRILG